MGMHKFIRIRGPEGARTGYFVPRMYPLDWSRLALKIFGFEYVKLRLTGCTIWWVRNEEDYINAIETLDELQKTRVFGYMVYERSK